MATNKAMKFNFAVFRGHEMPFIGYSQSSWHFHKTVVHSDIIVLRPVFSCVQPCLLSYLDIYMSVHMVYGASIDKFVSCFFYVDQHHLIYHPSLLASAF